MKGKLSLSKLPYAKYLQSMQANNPPPPLGSVVGKMDECYPPGSSFFNSGRKALMTPGTLSSQEIQNDHYSKILNFNMGFTCLLKMFRKFEKKSLFGNS